MTANGAPNHECDATNIAVAADGRQYCAHCGWNDPSIDRRAELERTKTMTIDQRIQRWLEQDGGEETEMVIDLFVDALYDVQKLRAALKACDSAFVHWQVGSVPGRPEDILALIQQVRAALAPEASE